MFILCVRNSTTVINQRVQITSTAIQKAVWLIASELAYQRARGVPTSTCTRPWLWWSLRTWRLYASCWFALRSGGSRRGLGSWFASLGRACAYIWLQRMISLIMEEIRHMRSADTISIDDNLIRLITRSIWQVLPNWYYGKYCCVFLPYGEHVKGKKPKNRYA
jgi:hypothetical protein